MSEPSGGGDRAGKLTAMAGGRRVDLGRRPPTREYVMEAVMTEWVQMLVTMADGPQQPVHGAVIPYRNSDEPFHYYFGSYGEEPVFLPIRLPGVYLYRWGRRSRIESLDGHVMFVSDGTTAWDFTADADHPRSTELRQVHSPGAGRYLAITPRVEHWVGNHHSRPTGPVTDVEFLGRRCWSVDLVPRESRYLPKPSLRLVVDAETGAVLAQHSGDGIDGAAYADLTVGEGLDLSLFAWDGPVVTDAESRILAGRGGPPVPPAQESMSWFREEITAEPIRVPLLTDLTPRFVHSIEPESGAFAAELGDKAGWIARRPRSSEPWKTQTYEYQIAWSTEDFDWVCQIHRGTLDAAGIESLQHQLHPGLSVVGTPELVFAGTDGY
ncbi:hypothetical protein ACFRFQ_21625 [Rhodococcus sp. NPDC056743]|uniref:hypothetical protein n=1 Tax=Rhodococcus sp. NPDC056743 TaxID=3345934 RepID=UPI00366D6B8F